MAESTCESIVLVENDDFVVTEERVPVGQLLEVHTHTAPFLLIALSGDRGEVSDGEGNLLAEVDYTSFTPGFMAYVGPELLPTTHAVRNTGAEPIVVIQVEFLRSAGGAGGGSMVSHGIET